ncbi:class I SAM-dependent methyltransferase [Acidovorax sp. SDU_ACID1]|uniref:class I SAM-dependent methyltransferase n=1 Tax=Acidovorax sp. SDU_ACID1 TaxID=3136632 RepID=UPI003873C325
MTQDESRRVQERYARRDAAADARRYALTDPYALAAWQERQRAIVRLLAGRDLAALSVLEVGCGSGGNLQDLLRLGVDPARVQGIELLETRAFHARAVLPAACRIQSTDALHADLPDASQDLVLLFTVFSSILSPGAQQALAARVWRWLRPGGAVLWHDFTVNNPRNPDVRGVPWRACASCFPRAVCRRAA